MHVHPRRLLKKISISTGTRNLGENKDFEIMPDKQKWERTKRKKRRDIRS